MTIDRAKEIRELWHWTDSECLNKGKKKPTHAPLTEPEGEFINRRWRMMPNSTTLYNALNSIIAGKSDSEACVIKWKSGLRNRKG